MKQQQHKQQQQQNHQHQAAEQQASPDTNKTNKASKTTLYHLIKESLEAYFAELDGAIIGNVYDLVISEVEKPLIEVVLKKAKNQSQAAKWLGISRNTLRKLLVKYNL